MSSRGGWACCLASDKTAQYYTGIDVSDAAAASMSIPAFYAPFPIYNPKTKEIDHYIDGEVRDTLSSHAAVDNGCEVVICSWTHSPYHFTKEVGSLSNYGIPAIALQAIYLLVQKKIVSSRTRTENAGHLMDALNEYFKDQKAPEQFRKDILAIVEKKLNYNSKVKFIDIYPQNHNHEMFFSANFSLSTSSTAKVVKLAYRRTRQVIEEGKWDN